MFGFDAFHVGVLDDNLRGLIDQAKQSIKEMPLDRLASAKDLVQRYSIAPPELHFDKVYVTSYEKEVSAEDHPSSFFIRHGESYKRQVVVYHVPVSGDTDFLRYAPNPNLMWTHELQTGRGSEGVEVYFEIIVFGDDGERVKRSYEEIKTNLTKQLTNVTNQIKAYNESLPHQIEEFVNQRKQELTKQSSILDQLGVPVKKSNHD